MDTVIIRKYGEYKNYITLPAKYDYNTRDSYKITLTCKDKHKCEFIKTAFISGSSFRVLVPRGCKVEVGEEVNFRIELFARGRPE